MTVRILVGDCRARLAELPAGSAHTCVTSPPYFGLRDYGVAGQIGLELTPDAFVAEMVAVFREVRRVLRNDGTLWLNLGDSYAGAGGGGQCSGQMSERAVTSARIATGGRTHGLKPKDLLGIPWMVAFALRADGWFLRQDIIWSKPNPMPESVRDRCTKAHEYVFLLSKSERYAYDAEAITEPASPNTHARLAQNVAAQVGSERAHAGGKTNGAMKAVGRKSVEPGQGIKANTSFHTATALHVERRNKRSVWTVATQPFTEAHFATYPPELIEPCILAGAPKGGAVLDPFGGAGTTALVAYRLGRDCTLIELNPVYAEIARARIAGEQGMFNTCQVEAA